ncbi:hypothetical protein ACFPN0_13890 [Kitasatospora cinereorecta]
MPATEAASGRRPSYRGPPERRADRPLRPAHVPHRPTYSPTARTTETAVPSE